MLTLALAQFASRVGDVAGNLATVTAHTAQAAAGGADLVVFPELALSGYGPWADGT
jgi:NAD+ synthase